MADNSHPLQTDFLAHARAVLDRRLFLVCGAQKSGTTWVQRMLDAHPQVRCRGEGHFFTVLSPALAKAVNAYNKQLATVAEQVYEGDPYYPAVSQPEFQDVLVTLAAGMMGRGGVSDTVRAVGDKTPNYALKAGFARKLLPAVRLVHVVRDGRDVAASALHHAYRAGIPGAIERHSEAYYRQMRSHAARWAQSVRAARAFGEAHPEQYVELRYEALLTNPADELPRVLDLLGVDASPAAVHSAVDAASFERLTGRRPGQEDKNAFIRKGAAGDWVNYFDAASLAVFDRESSNLRFELGYDDEPGTAAVPAGTPAGR